MKANPTFRPPSSIPSDRFKVPPRVIRFMLDSEGATNFTNTSMSWNIDLSGINPLKPGTVMLLRDLYISPGLRNHTVVWRLRGIDTENYWASKKPDKGIEFTTTSVDTGDGAIQQLVGSPLSVTLSTPESVFQNSKVTLSMMYSTGQLVNTSNAYVFDQNTRLRCGLSFIEPGLSIV